MLIAYVVLALTAAILAQPFVALWTASSEVGKAPAVILRGLGLTALIHGLFHPAPGGDPSVFPQRSRVRPVVLQSPRTHTRRRQTRQPFPALHPAPGRRRSFALFWQIRRRGRVFRTVAAVALCGIALPPASTICRIATPPSRRQRKANECHHHRLRFPARRQHRLPGYRPRRTDGPAEDGVSPTIDALAARSVEFRTLLHRHRLHHGVRRPAHVLPVSPEPRHPPDVSGQGNGGGHEKTRRPLARCSARRATTPPPSATGVPAITKWSRSASSIYRSPASTISRST